MDEEGGEGPEVSRDLTALLCGFWLGLGKGRGKGKERERSCRFFFFHPSLVLPLPSSSLFFRFPPPCSCCFFFCLFSIVDFFLAWGWDHGENCLVYTSKLPNASYEGHVYELMIIIHRKSFFFLVRAAHFHLEKRSQPPSLYPSFSSNLRVCVCV
ncbi:hypothetical protein LZ32DRAFT_263696 [Colletotrichum eremochloae]|nr:hypothetical protein LZ32DRAFT_263696 [Colletotrichum eremochloae]